MPDTVTPTPVLLASNIKVPQHVVFRSFPAETVILNLQTGKYHGLNATAGRMLDALVSASSVQDAARELASVYEQPVTTIEHDMCELSKSLLERGLIEIDAGPQA